MNCDCSANTSSDETRPSVASREEDPPTESRHIGKVESKAVVVGDTCASTPRDPAARPFSPRSSRVTSPLCVGTADEIDGAGDDAHVPVAHCRPTAEVARSPGTAKSPKVVDESLAIVLGGRVAIVPRDGLGRPAGASAVELERLGDFGDVGDELKKRDSTWSPGSDQAGDADALNTLSGVEEVNSGWTPLPEDRLRDWRWLVGRCCRDPGSPSVRRPGSGRSPTPTSAVRITAGESNWVLGPSWPCSMTGDAPWLADVGLE